MECLNDTNSSFLEPIKAKKHFFRLGKVRLLTEEELKTLNPKMKK